VPADASRSNETACAVISSGGSPPASDCARISWRASPRMPGQAEGGIHGAGGDATQTQGGPLPLQAPQQILPPAQVEEHPHGGLAIGAALGLDDTVIG
jgi:hypothetical protein